MLPAQRLSAWSLRLLGMQGGAALAWAAAALLPAWLLAELRSPWAWAPVSGGLALFGLTGWLRALMAARAIDDTPCSRVASAAQGYVELRGFAAPGPTGPLRAHLSGTECVWYRWTIETRQRDSHWRVVEQGDCAQPVVLRDASGACLIDPRGFTLTLARKRQWSGHGTPPAGLLGSLRPAGELRHTEELILEHEPLYALGEFVTEQAAAGFDLARETARLVAGWKRDMATLRARFDLNGDGEFSDAEWQRVRAAAQAEAEVQRSRLAQAPAQHRLHAARRRPSLLGTLEDGQLERRQRRRATLMLAVFFAALAVSGLLLTATLRGGG